jgi:hypothetical protein
MAKTKPKNNIRGYTPYGARVGEIVNFFLLKFIFVFLRHFMSLMFAINSLASPALEYVSLF